MTYTRVAVAQIPDWDIRPRLPREMATKLREWEGRIDPRGQRLLHDIYATVRELEERWRPLVDNRAISYVDAVIDFCRHRCVDVLVFPEQSIQPAWLPRLGEIASADSRERPGHPIAVMVAGTHLYDPVTPATEHYEACRLPVPASWSSSQGKFSVAPVLVWDAQDELQRGRLVPKREVSDFEPREQAFPFPDEWDPHVTVNVGGRELNLTVLTCYDFHASNPAEVCQARDLPHLVVSPSRTPYDSIFNDYRAKAREYRRRGCPTLIANSSHPLKCNGKPHPTGASLIYANVPPPHGEVDRDYPREKPLGLFIYPIPSQEVAVTVLDVDLERQREGFSEHDPQTLQVTVAPLVSRATFPEYCRFYETVRDQPPGNERHWRDCVCRNEGLVIRQKTLERLQDADSLFRHKLEEVDYACRLDALDELQHFANHDSERLVDVVAIPDDPPSRVEHLLGRMVDDLCVLREHVDIKCQPEVLRLALEVAEERQRLANGLGVRASPPAARTSSLRPTPTVVLDATEEQLPVPVLETSSGPPPLTDNERVTRTYGSLLFAQQFLGQAIYYLQRSEKPPYLQESVVALLDELLLVKKCTDVKTFTYFGALAKELAGTVLLKEGEGESVASFVRAVLYDTVERFYREVETLSQTEGDRQVKVLIDKGAPCPNRDRVWQQAEHPLDDPVLRSVFLRALRSRLIKSPTAREGFGDLSHTTSDKGIDALVEKLFAQARQSVEPSSRSLPGGAVREDLLDRVERMRKSVLDRYRDFPPALWRAFEQYAGLSIFFACSADPSWVYHGLRLAIQLVGAAAAFLWPSLWRRLAALPTPERDLLLSRHQTSGLEVFTDLARQIDLLFSAPEENWAQYREVFDSWGRLVAIYQEMTVLVELQLFDDSVQIRTNDSSGEREEEGESGQGN